MPNATRTAVRPLPRPLGPLLLCDDDCARILDTARRVAEEIGIELRDEGHRQRLAATGARCAGLRVTFPTGAGPLLRPRVAPRVASRGLVGHEGARRVLAWAPGPATPPKSLLVRCGARLRRTLGEHARHGARCRGRAPGMVGRGVGR
jgi:hypothetical protein